MITKKQALEFANDWIKAWNAHDLEKIISHYDENIEYYSMFLTKLSDNKSGKIVGKKSVKKYLKKGLKAYPNLYFKLENVYFGISTIVIQYISVNNLKASEIFEIGKNAKAIKVQCNYND